MNIKSHPDNELLKKYVYHADSEDFATLRLHLATCQDCRTQVDALSVLDNLYQGLKSKTSDEDQQQPVFDYVDGFLSETARQEARKHLDENPEFMKAALHYASHKTAMREVVHEGAGAISKSYVANKITLVDIVKGRINKWLNIQTPAWLTVPVTAIAIAMVIVMLQPDVTVTKGTLTVASFRDNAVMQFIRKDQIPGIGFFSKTDKYSRPYSNIAVNILSNGNINLMWPTVKDATEYKMRLQVFNNGQKKIIDEISTNGTQATFKINNTITNRRYEWNLTGETQDEMTFYATGGFVIDKAHRR